MPVLSDLEPREVFFSGLNACAPSSRLAPHKSDQRLSGRVRPRTRSCHRDAANNVVIRKAASAGYEKRAGRHAAGPYRHGLRKGRGLRQGYGNGRGSTSSWTAT